MDVIQFSDMSRPKISVCIANYNGEDLLENCIDSVLAQEVDADIEIVVHDDASTDASVLIIEQCYPQVRIISSSQNVGFCVANNRMTNIAKGEFLLLLNNDAELASGALSALLNSQKSIHDPCILTVPQIDMKTGRLVDRGCLTDPFLNPVPNLDGARSEISYVIGACLWIKMELWQTLHGFPEWFESVGEDLFLCGAARLQGATIRVTSDSFYRHHQGVSFGGNKAETELLTTFKRRRLSEINKTRSLFILTPTIVVWPLLAIHMTCLIFEGILLATARSNFEIFSSIYLPAALSPFKEFRELRLERSRMQAARRVTLAQWFKTTHWSLRKLTLLSKYGLPKIR
ncbi:glycosyltransferase family 2 protein [Lysobacter sp. HDW10]|uniref:glycosyltransferase family 2 protein n=1 Tax=Lysobacter sp. HDW10 TaxID=2714936 RepID=UPI0014079A14|nr:glycosyltransferase family 2 protein [Lysobacter sp. HDW10]QIK80341.1 glycosyltransferase family 2 protein [Lysobacter sp. HDW10]